MASPLANCTLEELCSIIRFLLTESVVFSRMLTQCVKSCMAISNVYKWVDRFKDDRTSVSYETRSPRPVSGHSLKARIAGPFRDNRRTTFLMIAEKVQVTEVTIYNIVHKNLKFRELCARGVPRELTDPYKGFSLSIAHAIKQRSLIDRNAFFERIVTCNEV